MKDFLEKLLEEFGENALVEENETILAISTGSISLDSSIGIGGIPRGRATEIFGPEGSGKTTICLNTAVNCVNEGGKALYIDAEHMLDYATVKSMLALKDIDKSRLIILRPDTAETAAQMIEYGIESGEFEAIFLDSIASLLPKEESEDDFEDKQMMLLSKFMAHLLRRNMAKVRNNKIAFVMVNQIRDDTSSKFLKLYSTPGGHAVKHWAALRISLSKGTKIEQGESTIGTLTKFTIAKNKLSSPFKSYAIPIIFGLGVDYYRDLLNFATDLGVITKKGPSYKYQDTVLGVGANKVIENLKLEENKKTLDKIKEMVYNIVHNQNIVLENLEETEESEVTSE